MIFLVIIGLIMAILAVLFAFQNATVVAISFGAWELEQSLAIVLICTLGLGIIISLLLSLPTILKRGWQTSQQKKKIADLETRLQAQNIAQSNLQQEDFAKRNAVKELLQAFSLSDLVTGLLTKDAIVQLAEHLLQQMQNQPHNRRYASLVAMLFTVEPAKSQRNFADVGSENAVYKAIANRFEQTIIPDSFLGITDRKRFVNLALGLKGAEITKYAEYVRQKIIETPLQKADGTLLPLRMNVGGVVVDPTDIVDSRNILKQAEHNLEQSREKGRSYVEITEITTKNL